jgi:hypothetical protein
MSRATPVRCCRFADVPLATVPMLAAVPFGAGEDYDFVARSDASARAQRRRVWWRSAGSAMSLWPACWLTSPAVCSRSVHASTSASRAGLARRRDPRHERRLRRYHPHRVADPRGSKRQQDERAAADEQPNPRRAGLHPRRPRDVPKLDRNGKVGKDYIRSTYGKLK